MGRRVSNRASAHRSGFLPSLGISFERSSQIARSSCLPVERIAFLPWRQIDGSSVTAGQGFDTEGAKIIHTSSRLIERRAARRRSPVRRAREEADRRFQSVPRRLAQVKLEIMRSWDRGSAVKPSGVMFCASTIHYGRLMPRAVPHSGVPSCPFTFLGRAGRRGPAIRPTGARDLTIQADLRGYA